MVNVYLVAGYDTATAALLKDLPDPGVSDAGPALPTNIYNRHYGAQRMRNGQRIATHTDMTKNQLIEELDGMRLRLAQLEQSEARHRQAAEALRVSGERYRVLLDESSDPIFTFYPDGRYLYVNRQFAAGFGKKPEEFIGKTLWEVFPKEEADQRFAAIRWVYENRQSKLIEARVPLADKDLYFLTTIKPILAEDGEVQSVICISKDFTERKQAEEALRRARDELESRVIERTQVLTETSRHLAEEIQTRRELERHLLDATEEQQARIGRELHDDLGQLLTGTAYLAGALSRALAGGEPEASLRAQEIASVIREAIKRTRYLSHGMVAFNIANQGLAGGLRQLADEVSDFSGIPCRFSCSGDAEIDDPATATHLYRIAQEAMNNAIKHSAARNLSIELRANDREIDMVVADDGMGMVQEAPQKQNRMGLMTMDFRAQLIGGRLTMATREGQGTRITITLPRR